MVSSSRDARRTRRTVPRPPVPARFESLEGRTLFCDWGWFEAASFIAPAAPPTAAVEYLAAYAHGGALHLDATTAPTRPVTTTAPTRLAASVTSVSPVTPAPGSSTLRIETGGSSSFTDSAGRVWSPDGGFSGGTASTGPYAVANTADDKLYSTRRWGNFSYARSVSSGLYTLKLHFADPLYTAPGFRLFDAFAEGSQILNDFDIAANGGGKAALVKTFSVHVADGRLDLSFRSVRENAIVSAVELVPATTVPQTAPATPSDARVDPGISHVALSWTDRSDNEAGFKVERKDGASGSWRQIATVAANDTSYADDDNLKAGVDYCYRVRAYNAVGTSGASAQSAPARVEISTLTWKSGAASPITRAEPARGVVNGKMYVFGGYYNAKIQATPRSDVYDPVNNTWKRLPDMPVAITHQGMVTDGSVIWLIGGYVGDHPGPSTTQVWKFDTAKTAWSRGPSLPEPRGAGAAAMVGRKIYFFGGMNQARTVDMGTHWVLDLDNQSAGWKRMADMPNPRNHLSGIAHGGKVYAIGGHWQQEHEAVTQREVDMYDPATNKWTRVADTPGTPRSQTPAATFLWKDRIVLVGGADATEHSTTVISAYIASENRWENIGHLPAARRATAASLINGRIVVTTGNDPYPSATTWVSSLLAE